MGLRGPVGGVEHPEWLEQPCAEHLVERLPGGARHQHAQHRGAGVVQPALAGLGNQRQRAEARDPDICVRLRYPVRRADRRQTELLLGGGHDWPRRTRGEHLGRQAEAEREREQIASRDRARRRHGLLQTAVGAFQHLAIGQFGEQPVDRVVDPQQSFLDHRERRRRGDRLGDRRDPEQRVALYRWPTDAQVAERLDEYLFTVGHQRDEPGHAFVADVRLGGREYLVEAHRLTAPIPASS